MNSNNILPLDEHQGKYKEGEYIGHLYGHNLEGYIQAVQLKDGRLVYIKTINEGIAEVQQQLTGKEDVYITPNTFFVPKREARNIRHFRALFIDLDTREEWGKAEAVYELYILSENKRIPKPTMIVDSGRGLHAYWRIKDAPVQAAYTWQELQDYLYKQLRHLGSDIKATSAANVLRMPGSINSKNNEPCKVLFINNYTYDMKQLRQEFIYKPKQKKQQKRPGKVKHLFNSYSLHYARAADIETLCRLRSYHVTGHRNFILHCYAYWKGIYQRGDGELLQTVRRLNNGFSEPLRDAEVKSIVKSVEKAIKKFIDYEQGIRTGERKRVTKGMRDKGGYWYTNKTLVERLDISPAEMKVKDSEGYYLLKTIISKEEKYSRNNEKRRKQRRNKQGLTKRQQQVKERQEAILELKQQGYTIKDIADRLKLHKTTIYRHLR